MNTNYRALCLRVIKQILKPVLSGFWLILIPLLTSCSSSMETVAAGLPDYDPQLAYRLVNQEKAILLDVRSVGEFLSGHLNGSVNIPVEELSSRMDEVKTLVKNDMNRPIVVYCAAGVRAADAKMRLSKAGFTRVTNLGSIRSWPGQR